jgi:hypothetical protein
MKTHRGFTLGVLAGLGLALAISALLPVQMLAQVPADSVNERAEIQEKLLYAYAYAIDSNDCVSFSNLFTTDAVYEVTVGAELISIVGRDAILQACIAGHKSDVGKIRTRHNMMNIVFDKLTARRAETRTYVLLTWQKIW